MSNRSATVHHVYLADILTPVSAFMRLSADSSSAFLLESVEGGEQVGRYSFIGVQPVDSFSGSFADFRRQFTFERNQQSGLPPFSGGAVGLFSYEMIRELEQLPLSSKPVNPYAPRASVAMDMYRTVVAFDHVLNRIHIISEEGKQAADAVRDALFSPGPALPPVDVNKAISGDVLSSYTEAEFIDAVQRAREYIAAGDIFQVVLSQRFETAYEGDPFNVYRALRAINPSPYLYFLRQGDLSIAGASPEMLVRVQDRDLQYRPIAGTRRRGMNPQEEQDLEAELLADEKERAEHVMLVDLGRNDLGRVSSWGSVEVERFMDVEKYSHVMHLVSRLKGQLQPGSNCFDALEACFPAGTVTGAPKIRAMEIIDELEPVERGVYAGAIGYVDRAGNLDTCIAIRTIVMRGGRACLQAGAGIVADSDPRLEYKECRNKARALIRAVELARSIKPGGAV